MEKNEFEVVHSVAEWAEIRDRLNWLAALEAAGVDNWIGIDYANDLYDAGDFDAIY